MLTFHLFDFVVCLSHSNFKSVISFCSCQACSFKLSILGIQQEVRIKRIPIVELTFWWYKPFLCCGCCHRQEGWFKVLCVFVPRRRCLQSKKFFFPKLLMLLFGSGMLWTHEWIHLTLTTFSAYNPHNLIHFLWLPKNQFNIKYSQQWTGLCYERLIQICPIFVVYFQIFPFAGNSSLHLHGKETTETNLANFQIHFKHFEEDERGL